MFDCAWPWVLLLVPLPWLVMRLCKPVIIPPETILRLPYGELPLAIGLNTGSVARSRAWVAGLIWLLLLSAAARPQWIGESLDLPRTGRDLLLAVDASGSMSTQDMTLANQAIPRFAAVKVIAGDFIQRRVGDRVGSAADRACQDSRNRSSACCRSAGYGLVNSTRRPSAGWAKASERACSH